MQAGLAVASRHVLGSHRSPALAATASPSPYATQFQQRLVHRRLLTSPAADILLQRWEKKRYRLVSNCGVQCVMDLLRNWFEVQRTYEFAHADLAVRPFGVGEDLWLPVQVKTCKQKSSSGGRAWFFHLVQQYAGMPVVCVALREYRIWCYDGSMLKEEGGKSGHIAISENGKWDHEKFRCSATLEGQESLAHKLLLAYHDTAFIKDSLGNIMRQRSETHQKGEESVAAWAPLLSAAGMDIRPRQLRYEDTPVDAVWRWNGKKFLKSAGRKGARLTIQLYEEQDFDLLAVSVPGDRYFYLIPTEVLVQRGKVRGNGERRKCSGSSLYLWTPEAQVMQKRKEENGCRGRKADFWASEYLIDTCADDGRVGRLHAILEGAKCSK
ncbi:unnamed protein product [Vitrella brassicaformis CCMP3155]|uniref:Uncharacterized protein n=1 Tax=Vitrella brassicaformis (strain CCMP3155) TaxID=1169540 RepID=A0A0G4ETF0_VITBC|nr:unnamed protein product [Vitrella brassicaformis CCMP3155]|eukprot:CEM00933.1 unnamed protein product [Vitrella brassicaformis CCMP3155]